MPLGMEVGLGLGHIALDGDPSAPKNAAQPPIFGPCLLWPNGRPSQLLRSTCSIFQDGGGRHLGFLKFRNFNGGNVQEGQSASPN